MFRSSHQSVTSSLRIKRRACHMTQDELAGIAGVTRQTIIAIEKGNYTPSVLLAIKLARVLRTTVEELFTI